MIMMLLMCSAALAGCLGDDEEEKDSSSEVCSGDELIIAYEIKEDMNEDDIQNPQQIANYCLLYTSPSPRDKRQSRMPSSA